MSRKNPTIAQQCQQGAKELQAKVDAKIAVNKSADAAYEVRLDACHELLQKIGEKIDAHSKRQSDRRTDWTFAGDLSHVQELLEQVNEFLGN